MRKLLFALLLGLGLSACDGQNRPPDPLQLTTPLPAASDTLRLLFAGDAMQHKEQYRAALGPDGTYDYSACFAHIRPYVEAADLAVVNLETTLPGPPYAGYPNFRSPDAYAAGLVEAGFDILTLANNHSVDAGNHGVLRTMQVCDSLGAKHLGTYANKADRQARTPLLVTRKGITLALLNYTYGTNYQFTQPPVSVNYIDTLQIKADLATARAAQPDAIIVLLHWGLEYKLEPLPAEEQLAALCFREGAKLVIGGHPHVVRRADRLPYDTTEVAVVYSMGNFLSAQRHPNTDGGLLAGITLVKDSTGTRITDAGYHLTWVNRRPVGETRIYEILPVAAVEKGLLNPVWENDGRRKLDRFASNARAVLQQNTRFAEMPAHTWLGKPLGRQTIRLQPAAVIPPLAKPVFHNAAIKAPSIPPLRFEAPHKRQRRRR